MTMTSNSANSAQMYSEHRSGVEIREQRSKLKSSWQRDAYECHKTANHKTAIEVNRRQ